MATKTFGKQQLDGAHIIADLYKIAGANFPLELQVSNGQVLRFSFETEWKEGGTEEQIVDHKDGSQTIEHVGKYKDKKLTKEQIAKLEKWAAENVAT